MYHSGSSAVPIITTIAIINFYDFTKYVLCVGNGLENVYSHTLIPSVHGVRISYDNIKIIF